MFLKFRSGVCVVGLHLKACRTEQTRQKSQFTCVTRYEDDIIAGSTIISLQRITDVSLATNYCKVTPQYLSSHVPTLFSVTGTCMNLSVLDKFRNYHWESMDIKSIIGMFWKNLTLKIQLVAQNVMQCLVQNKMSPVAKQV